MATIKSYNNRYEALSSERSSFMGNWGDLSEYHLGNHGRFLSSDNNKGNDNKTRKQFNNKSRLAARVMASGMMSGITSPARPWFQLATNDPELTQHSSVKQWLAQVESKMYRVFSQSNIYNVLHNIYLETGVFGTGAIGIYEDFDDVIRAKHYTIGSYCIDQDGKNKVDTFYRKYQLSVGQVVKEFGIENCSDSVTQNWNKGNLSAWVEVIHVIEPNDDRDEQSPMADQKPIRSVYYEYASENKDQDVFLRVSGFDELPIMAPRWSRIGEDIYGTDCPGMTALGDTKALQLGETRKYQALDKIVSPTLQGPSSMRSQIKGTLRPNQIVFSDNPNQKLESIYNVNYDLNAMQAVNQEAEHRIDSAFYVDLFTMMMNSDRRQITATEVAEKQEEKLLMLGPVLESLHSELLDPLIGRTFSIMQKSGILPPPPPELEGVDLNIEYVSILAQAQRMVAVGGIDRVVEFAAQLGQFKPEALKKINALQAVDDYAEGMGINPNIIVPNDDIEKQLQAEAQAAQQQQAAAQLEQGAAIGKTLGDTNTDQGNALGDMLNNAGLQ